MMDFMVLPMTPERFLALMTDARNLLEELKADHAPHLRAGDPECLKCAYINRLEEALTQ